MVGDVCVRKLDIQLPHIILAKYSITTGRNAAGKIHAVKQLLPLDGSI
jgi:hypothetical protein